LNESPRNDARTIYRRLFAEARPFWPHVAALFALNLFSAPLKLLVPLPLKIAVDNVIGGEPLGATASWLPGMEGSAGRGTLLSTCRSCRSHTTIRAA
jgi:hypothetical protein